MKRKIPTESSVIKMGDKAVCVTSQVPRVRWGDQSVPSSVRTTYKVVGLWEDQNKRP